MCGISGILAKSDTATLRTQIRKTNDRMSHRGPDADGFFVEEGIALGHRRLSILDLSSAANQPFSNTSERFVMVFNGEIYNFNEIKLQLPDYSFRTTSDTEVVLAAFAKWGPACLGKMRGMFALAIWDRKERSLFLARDRFGVKPLYYFKDDHHFIFASEIRAILASGIVPRRLNKSALKDYLKYQSIVAPYTLVDNIYQVPAGTYMIVRDGIVEQKVYWRLTDQKREPEETDIGRIHKKIRDLMYQSVERRMVSDVPLGAFLSGGIDSSAVVAIMSQVNKSTTNAFTIAFEEKEYNELPYAELVARKFKVNHSHILLRPENFLDDLPRALQAMDTPSGDGLNTYVVSEAIRKNGMTVALSGIGGDELFAGYPIFRQFYDIKRREKIFDKSYFIRKTAAALMPGSDQRTIRMKSVLSAPASDISDIYPLFRQIQTATTIHRLTDAAHLNGGGNTLERLLKEEQAAIDRFGLFSQVSIADYLGYTQSVLLKDADQMSMAHSLELREPFFDNDLVEYVLNIPDKIKFPDYPKKLLVESMGELLPGEIVFRKKQGFVLPYDVWIRNELRTFCDQKMRSLAAREYFDEGALMGYWQRYLDRKSNIRWADVWEFVVLEDWLEKNEIR